MEIDIQTLIGLIFGVGGVGALTAVVAGYRRLKSGKISDDDAVINRLYGEIKRKDESLDETETEREQYRKRALYWEEKAIRFRLQLIREGHEPEDDLEGPP